MSIAFTRGIRRAAVLCLVAAAGLVGLGFANTADAHVAPTAHAVVSQRTGIDSEVRGMHSNAPVTLDGVLGYSPVPSSEKPLTVVYLHGIHGLAANGCPHIKPGANDVGWLVCPKADAPLPNGTASWSLDVSSNARTVGHALAAAQNAGASSEPGVAVGFSQGGYTTLDIVKSGKVHFRGLVLIAAPEAHPTAAKLHQQGVQRVVLAAGQRDAAYWPLKKDAARLASEGMDVKFVDLGDVGHTYAAENTAALHDAIVWAAGRS